MFIVPAQHIRLLFPDSDCAKSGAKVLHSFRSTKQPAIYFSENFHAGAFFRHHPLSGDNIFCSRKHISRLAFLLRNRAKRGRPEWHFALIPEKLRHLMKLLHYKKCYSRKILITLHPIIITLSFWRSAMSFVPDFIKKEIVHTVKKHSQISHLKDTATN